MLDQRQWESTYFGIASLQKTTRTSTSSSRASPATPASPTSPTRSATWCSTASRRGPTGRASPPACRATAAGRSPPSHTLRGGFLVQRERVTSYTRQYLPLVPTRSTPTGDPTSPTSPSASPRRRPVGWTYSVYLQDEWKVMPTVTVNFGLRFDAINRRHPGEPAQPAHQRRVAAQRRADRCEPAIPAISRRRRSTRSTTARSRAGLGTTAAPALTTERPGEGRTLALFRRRPRRSSRSTA